MATTITCPGCGFVGHVDRLVPGDRLQCPKCAAVITVTSSAPPASTPVPHAADPGHDDFYASLARHRAGPGPEVIDWLAGSSTDGPARTPAPPGPPSAEPPDDPQLECDWLREERQRFDQYVQAHREQLEQVEKRQQQWAAFNAATQAQLVADQQELCRQRTSVRAREAALAEREQQAREAAAEVERCTRQARAAQAACEAMTRDAAARTAAAAAEESRLAERAAELQRRQADVERAERESDERTAALDTAEARLRRDVAELDKRQRQVAEAEQAIERRGREVEELSRLIEDKTEELSRLEQALEAAGQEIERRAAVLEDAGRRISGIMADMSGPVRNQA